LLQTFTGNTSDYLWPLVKANLHALKSIKTANAVSELGKLAKTNEELTHTGQQYAVDDYRRIRFEVGEKKVNKNFAIDLIKEDPVVVCSDRIVWSSGGGPLGHPKVFIRLDANEIHDCGYSGRKFIHKKFYDPAVHGKSISYDEYLKEMEKEEYEIDLAN
jgi:NADH dehydrogenase (ubiquinone) Fe-S protein 6